MSRIRQFLKDILSPLRDVDVEFLDRYLDETEKKEFLKLRKAEVLHSIEVAEKTRYSLESLSGITEREKNLIIKAALVHDIGKIMRPLCPVGKAFAVLLGKINGHKDIEDGLYVGDSEILKVYYNHPHEGAEIMKRMDSFREFPFLYDMISHHGDPEDFMTRLNDNESAIMRIYLEADEES